MSSGVTLEDDLVDRFNKDLKMKTSAKFTYMIFCFTPDKKKIRIEHEGTEDDELVKQVKALRDGKKACYLVYHQKLDPKEGQKKGTQLKLVLYSDDDNTAVSDRLLIASSFDALKKKLEGIQAERQLHSFDELLEDLELQDTA